MNRRPHLNDWLMLFSLVIMWGSAFLLTKLTLASTTPLVVAAGRVLIGAAVLVVVLSVIMRHTFPGRGLWREAVLFSLLGNVAPFFALAWGQQHVDSATAGILMAVIPLFVITLAHFVLPGERLTPTRVVGFGLGFVGVIGLIGPDSLLGLGDDSLALAGQLAILGGAICYAVNAVLVRRICSCDPLSMAAATLAVSSVITVPLAAVDATGTAMRLDGTALAALAALGLFSTGLGSVFYFRLVQRTGPAFVSSISYLIPVWAVLLGVFFLDEKPETSALGGLLLILVGLTLGQIDPGRLQRPLRSPRALTRPLIRRTQMPARAVVADAKR